MLKFGKDFNNLDAVRKLVSVHKCGIFLCRQGTARVLLGSHIYQIHRNHLCIYTPNTFLQILEYSDDLYGILEEDSIDTYYPMISSIGIRERMLIRSYPCVVISEEQSQSIIRLVDIIRKEQECFDADCNNRQLHNIHDKYLRQLRFAVCMRVLETYFSNTPLIDIPRNRQAEIVHRFIISVYEHCLYERTVQYYADEQHLSPYYFSSIIKANSGRGALQWIEAIVMTHIRDQLATTDLSVKLLAEIMHFPDQSSFCRYFKRLEGRTPLEYRASITGPVSK